MWHILKKVSCSFFTYSEDELISSSEARYAHIILIRKPWKWHTKVPVTNGKQHTSSNRVMPTEAYFDSPARRTAPQTAELQSFSGVNQKQWCVQDEYAASPNRGGKIQLLGTNYKVESHSKVSMGSLSLQFLYFRNKKEMNCLYNIRPGSDQWWQEQIFFQFTTHSELCLHK